MSDDGKFVSHKIFGLGMVLAEDGPDLIVQFIRRDFMVSPPLVAVHVARGHLFPASPPPKLSCSVKEPTTLETARQILERLQRHRQRIGGTPDRGKLVWDKPLPYYEPVAKGSEPAEPFSDLHVDLFARTGPKLLGYMETARHHTTMARSKVERYMDRESPGTVLQRAYMARIGERDTREQAKTDDEVKNVAPKQTPIYPYAVFAYERRKAAKRKEHICEHCGKPFESKRRDARVCSAKCRKAASRRAVTDSAHLPPLIEGKEMKKQSAQQRLDLIEAVDRFGDAWERRRSSIPPVLASLRDPFLAWVHDHKLVAELYDLMLDAMGKLIAFMEAAGVEDFADLPEKERVLATWLLDRSNDLSAATKETRTGAAEPEEVVSHV